MEYQFVDCRFDLAAPARAIEGFQSGHIPGASFLDLDSDLSDMRDAPASGRHPLPTAEAFAAAAGRAGIGNDVFVVAYDDAMTGGAARLWWLLRHFGHDDVAVLEGGLSAWRGRLEGGDTRVEPVVFEAQERTDDTMTADEILARLGDPELAIVDARAPERFAGDPSDDPGANLDPVRGHIPGAVNVPFAGDRNFDEALLRGRRHRRLLRLGRDGLRRRAGAARRGPPGCAAVSRLVERVEPPRAPDGHRQGLMSAFDQLLARGVPLMPRPLVRRFAAPYIAGETLAEAVETSRRLNAAGKRVTIDVLGEEIDALGEAVAIRDTYIAVLDALAQHGLDGDVSVKPTGLGLNIDRDACRDLIGAIAEHAAARGTTVEIDMEDSSTTTDILAVYHELRGARPREPRDRAAGDAAPHARRHRRDGRPAAARAHLQGHLRRAARRGAAGLRRGARGLGRGAASG